MIPIKLSLANFMCYRDHTSLDFSGINVACLSGSNGAGKSAILDAITWALWGRGRAKTDDEFIALGCKEMEVDFEFDLPPNSYRVIRRRLKKSSGAGQGVLELQINDGDVWRSITGNTMHETQAKLTNILRMDYETFINSAFILQGRADEFTVKRPADRKKILADILGLSYYDRLETAARESMREQDDLMRTLQGEVTALEAHIARKDEYEAEILTAGNEENELKHQVEEISDLLQGSRDKVTDLLYKWETIKSIDQAIARTNTALSDARNTAAQFKARIDADEQLLARRNEINQGYDDLKAARLKEADMSRRFSDLGELRDQAAHIQRLIDEEANKLKGEQNFLKKQMFDKQNIAEKARTLRERRDQLTGELAKTGNIEAELAACQESITATASRIHLLQTQNTVLKQEMDELKKRVDLLKESAAECPLCGSDLGEDEHKRIEDNYNAEGKAKADLHRQNAAEVIRLQDEDKGLKALLVELQNRQKGHRKTEQEIAVLEKGIADADAAEQDLAISQIKLVHVLEQLNNNEYALPEQQALAQLNAQISALAYDPEEYRKIREAIQGLQSYEVQLSQLERAEHEIEHSRAGLAAAERSEKDWQTKLTADMEQKAALSAEVTGLQAANEELKSLTEQHEAMKSHLENARERLTRAIAGLDHVREAEQKKSAKSRSYDEAAKQKAVFQELSVAFGKKGIQAMIIESIIPEIEEEANSLLSRMTEGRMNVKFETQRDTKQGDTVETLDIKLSDGVGTRNYELYSGGEAFRANFAIRIALSKLLAKRAGARLQTLVVDEGFGTQDEQGKERLVEAINSIKDEFEKILVVTHIQELKDLFPVRIDVTKTGEGSQITIN